MVGEFTYSTLQSNAGHFTYGVTGVTGVAYVTNCLYLRLLSAHP